MMYDGMAHERAPRAPQAVGFTLGLTLLALLLLVGRASAAPTHTDDAPYAVAVDSRVTLTPLLTVAETVTRTRTGAPDGFRMVGIPDGLGLYVDEADGMAHLYMNHELNQDVVSMPLVGEPPLTGAFVSEYILDPDTMAIVSGDLAYDTVYVGADPTPATGTFSRFCSGSMAPAEAGFDRPIYFTGEESGSKNTFDGQGGVAVAIFDDAAYVLPDLSHFSKENVVPAPHTGERTLLFGLEDGPSEPESQLYLYVGTKDAAATHPLAINGLVGGALYVFASAEAGVEGEAALHKGDDPLTGQWVEIPDAASLGRNELEEAAQAAGAFDFVRVEDGSAPSSQGGTLYFTTTGSDYTDDSGALVNHAGRLYRLTFDPTDPIGGAAPTLTVLLEGDQGDPLVNPDNLDITADGSVVVIQENPISDFRGPELGRDASIWLYETETAELTRIIELDQTPVFPDAYPKDYGDWESSGIIDASAVYGEGTWLFNVQAHSIDSALASQLQGESRDAMVEQGGQLLAATLGTPGPVAPSRAEVIDGGLTRPLALAAAGLLLALGAGAVVLRARRR